MSAVLFVSNGHGEASIARLIAAELRAHGSIRTEHFALVGRGLGSGDFVDVGPQRAMPSGGLVAMGNVRAFAADVRAGFFGLLARQLAFLRSARGRYAAVVAVGDAYALLLARAARASTVFVGTAKSVYVAPYGPMERKLLRSALAVFVRDRATAEALRAGGVAAHAPGNVIVDLLASNQTFDWGDAQHRIAILPGSRERAYGDAARLAAVVRALARRVPGVAAAMSVAPGLDAARFAQIRGGTPPIPAWQGELGALLGRATLALGQAGTANEAAAASGVPVVALELDDDRKSAWYRMRQARLLGEALAIVPGEPEAAARVLAELLHDAPRRARMAAIGRERMGSAGGARAIAYAIARIAGGAC
ncbi:MAG: lipid-A-disaccharide synthase-related protein [Candidatus Velthaea sp.]